jgi:integrase
MAKRRPKAEQYRGLYLRGGVIYFERERDGAARIRVSTKSSDWIEAAAFRDEWLLKHDRPGRPAVMPTLADFTARYLEHDTAHLASRTKRDRKKLLGAKAPPLVAFGPVRLDDITPASLKEWWGKTIEKPYVDKKGRTRTRSLQTGRHHVNALAAVLAYAVDLALLDVNPVDAFRLGLKRRQRTKRGRAATASKIRPIEAAPLAALLREAREEGLEPYALALALCDAGLRLGEARALTWGQIAWGTGADDRSRSLVIDRSRPTHGDGVEPPKSGRVAAHLRPGEVRPPGAQRPPRHVRLAPALTGDSARVRVLPARPRGRGRHCEALRGVVWRGRVPRAAARRAARAAGRPAGTHRAGFRFPSVSPQFDPRGGRRRGLGRYEPE